MPYQPGGDQTSSGNFPTGAAPTGVSSQWANVQVVTRAAGVRTGWRLPPGQQTHSIKELLGMFDQESEDEIATLQQQLWDSGFYSKNARVTPGAKDYATRKAFENALKDAAHEQVPFGDLLTQRADERAKAGLDTPLGQQAAANVIQHHSLADLSTGALAGFQAALGRGPTAKEAAAFQAAYRASETAGDPQSAAQAVGPGGTANVTDPGSISNAAQQFAVQQNPNDAQSYSKLQAFDTMIKALGVKG